MGANGIDIVRNSALALAVFGLALLWTYIVDSNTGDAYTYTQLLQDAKAKKSYQYAPNESVVATCTAPTFFSHDMEPPASTPGKPGQPAAAKKQGTI